MTNVDSTVANNALDTLLLWILVFLALPLVMLGCRTYGGHGSEQLTIQQIEKAVSNFGQSLNRAQFNMESLQQTRSPAVSDSFVERYKTLVEAHREIYTKQEERLDELRGSDDYRKLSRALGAFITEQEGMAKQYRALVTAADTTIRAFEVPPMSRYYMVPPFYERIRNARRTTRPTLPSEIIRDTTQLGSPSPGDSARQEAMP